MRAVPGPPGLLVLTLVARRRPRVTTQVAGRAAQHTVGTLLCCLCVCRQRGAAQVLRRLLQDWTDEDLRLGASQLLGTIGSSAPASSTSAGAAYGDGGGGGGGGSGGGGKGPEAGSVAPLVACPPASGGQVDVGVTSSGCSPAAQQQQQQQRQREQQQQQQQQQEQQQRQQRQEQQRRLAVLNAQLQDGMELLQSAVASKGLHLADARGCSLPDAPQIIRNMA